MGWDDDYRRLAKVGREAVFAHPGTYAKGVARDLRRLLVWPLYAPTPAAGETRGIRVPVADRQLPVPGEGEPIPSARQSSYITTPDQRIREVWTSPTEHHIVFSRPGDEARAAEIDRRIDDLVSSFPDRSVRPNAVDWLNSLSRWYPRPVLWLVLGVLAALIRRPRRFAAPPPARRIGPAHPPRDGARGPRRRRVLGPCHPRLHPSRLYGASGDVPPRPNNVSDMPDLALVPKSELDRVRGAAGAEPDARLALLADMCRLNTLVAIKCAGSGHLGSSFSALDIMAHLLYEELNVGELGFDHPERDVFPRPRCPWPLRRAVRARFAAGATAPSPQARGLDGHPDVGIPGIEANSGSLGMGISKGRGIAWAKWSLGFGGRVVVMTGDGELQEGQNWEALQAAAHERLGTLWVVVDRNELQSDKPTEEIVALGDLEAKLEAFGWDVRTCDGHDHAALREAFAALREIEDRPNALIAQTVKGKGVSFMERSAALAEGGGYYMWHAGAPDDDDFERARDELVERIGDRLEELGLGSLELASVARAQKHVSYSLEGEPESGAGAPLHKVTEEYVVEAYGEARGARREQRSHRRARRRSRVRLSGPRLRARLPRSLRRVRDRGAGHGLGRGGSRAPRLPPRGELIRVIPRIAGQRADLQPGERGVEGRLRAPLRGAHSRGTGEVAPERARHLASRRART